MPVSDVALAFRVGARTVWTLRRQLVRRRVTLAEALAAAPPDLPRLGDDDQGYLITSLPAAFVGPLAARYPALRALVRQRYRRSYAALDGSFDDYLAGFSSKSRSTLLRKVRKLAARSGGELDIRCYPGDGDIAQFYALARTVSAITYQERLLDAGLPEGPEAVDVALALAARDAVRAWLLFLDGRPVAYLYAPAEGDTLIYAHLGYDPAFAEFSPGTVLQIEAIRRLLAEGPFRLFDFTEGDGRHKRQFATGGIDSVDLMLLRPTLANLGAVHALNLFDRCVAVGREVVKALGGAAFARRLRR